MSNPVEDLMIRDELSCQIRLKTVDDPRRIVMSNPVEDG